MAVDRKILEEIRRYKDINSYITEQDAGAIPPPPIEGGDLGAAPPPPLPPGGAAPTPTGTTEPTPLNIENDPDVEEVGVEGEIVGQEGDTETEEIDITDLVDTQKTMSEKQEEYFNNLFSQLETLQSKLGEMDQLVQKLNSIETKVDNYRPKTPEEKLELRSLDSGPFKQKLSDFFEDKLPEMEKSGKNEYVLTSDEIENYSPAEIEKSFDEDDKTSLINDMVYGMPYSKRLLRNDTDFGDNDSDI